MKKYILVIAIVATIAMTACGSGSTTKETTDSTTTKIDSVKVSDSTHKPDTIIKK